MGFFRLLFKARLEGVQEVVPAEGKEWVLGVKCSSCGEDHHKEVIVDPTKQQEHSGTRGTFNFIMKCKFCDHLGTINFRSAKSYKSNEEMQEVADLECRGLIVTKWEPGPNWAIVTSSGKQFEESLEESDWCEYDEDLEQVVGVYEIQTDVS